MTSEQERCGGECVIVHPPSKFDRRGGESRRWHEPCPGCPDCTPDNESTEEKRCEACGFPFDGHLPHGRCPDGDPASERCPNCRSDRRKTRFGIGDGEFCAHPWHDLNPLSLADPAPPDESTEEKRVIHASPEPGRIVIVDADDGSTLDWWDSRDVMIIEYRDKPAPPDESTERCPTCPECDEAADGWCDCGRGPGGIQPGDAGWDDSDQADSPRSETAGEREMITMVAYWARSKARGLHDLAEQHRAEADTYGTTADLPQVKMARHAAAHMEDIANALDRIASSAPPPPDAAEGEEPDLADEDGVIYVRVCPEHGIVADEEPALHGDDPPCDKPLQVLEVVPLARATAAEEEVERIKRRWEHHYGNARAEQAETARDNAVRGAGRRQAAIDKALSALNSTAYVGGPSEAEAWRTALDALGPFRTEPQGANPDTKGESDG